MLGKYDSSKETLIESTKIDEVTGNVSVTTSTTKSTSTKTDNQMFSEILGIGKYFIIFCLIMFFIAPVYAELNSDYQWEITKNGNTYTYINPKDDVSNYKDLGNKMLGGFTETLETIGNISQISGKLIETLETPLSWFKNAYEYTLNGYNIVLDWFNGLFD